LTSIIRETIGIVDVLTKILSSNDQKLTLAFIYGAIPKGENESTSNINLVLVEKDRPCSDIIELPMPAEESMQQNISPSNLSAELFRTRFLKTKFSKIYTGTTQINNKGKITT
jgi:hypothetical protein